MKRLLPALLLCLFLASSSSSAEDAITTSTLRTDISSTAAPAVSIEATKNENASNPADEEHKSKEHPVELLPSHRIFLDPNIALARVARDVYGGWGLQRQSFGSTNQRRPFGIEGFYNGPNGYYRPPEPPRRRIAQVRRYKAAPKPFRVYPVFPG